MVNSKNKLGMFTFSTNLWFNKHAVSNNNYASLYLRIYIGNNGYRAIKYIPLKLRWPVDKINLDGSTLLSRFVKDPDVNDYNLIILSERAKHNEIAKLFRLSDTSLNMELFEEQLNLFDHRKALVSFMQKKRKMLLNKKHIVESTYKNIGSFMHILERIFFEKKNFSRIYIYLIHNIYLVDVLVSSIVSYTTINLIGNIMNTIEESRLFDSQDERIANRFKQLRKSLNLSQSEFATKAKIAQSSISEVERNVKAITSEILLKLKLSCNINWRWLAKDEGEMFKFHANNLQETSSSHENHKK